MRKNSKKGEIIMRKNSKTKSLALLTSLILLTSTVGQSVVMAASDEYSLDYFTTFEDYVKEDSSDVWPDGWGRWIQSSSAVNTRGTIDSEGTRSMKYTGGIPMYPFGTLVQKGMAHISFDLKLDSELLDGTNPTNVRIMGSTSKTGSKHPDSYCHTSWGIGVQNYYIDITSSATTLFTGDDISVWRTTDVTDAANGANADLGTAWHKYDLIFDLDNNTYTPYIDGQKLVKELAYNADGDPVPENNTYWENLKNPYDLKSIYFQAWGTVWLDNFSAVNYARPADGEINAPVMKADEGAGVDMKNGSVAVSFSEAVAKDLTAENFTVTNIETGATVVPTAVTALANSSYRLSFGELSLGTYRVTANNVTGLISGKAAVSDAVFSTSASQKANEKELVLIDDNFSDYTSGVPSNWYNYEVSNDEGWIVQFAAPTVEATTGPDGSKAIKLSNSDTSKVGSIYHKFDNDWGMHAQNFTVEFDVMETSSNWYDGWAIGLVRESDLHTDYKYSTADRTNLSVFHTYDDFEKWNSGDTSVNVGGADKQAIARQSACNLIAGSYKDNEFQIQNNAYSLHNLSVGGVNDADTEQKVTGQTWGKWYNIKLEINLQGAKITPTVDGVTYPARDIPKNMLKNIVQFADGGAGTIYNNEIVGIRFQVANDAVASFANVKVYKNDSYLTNQDFEGRPSANTDIGWTSKALQNTSWISGWTTTCSASVSYTDYNSKMTTTTGKNSDTALQINGTDGNFWYENTMMLTKLDKGIAAKKGFVVEFDAKQTGSDNTCGWHLLTRADAVTGAGPRYAVFGIEGTAIKMFDGEWQGNTDQNALGGNTQTAQNIEADKWYHYKAVWSPKGNGNSWGYTVLYVTDENGTTMRRVFDSDTRNNMNTAVNWIGFNVYAGTTLAVDNLKVYAAGDTDTVGIEEVITESYMELAYTESFTGERTYFSEANTVIPADTKNIVVEFSGSPASADTITLKNSSDAAVGTKTINGNKCVISLAGIPLVKDAVYTLTVPSGIEVDGAATKDEHTYNLTVAENGKLVITSILMYDNVAVTDGGTTGNVSEGGDVQNGNTHENADVILYAVAAKQGNAQKFIVKGYNTGAATQLLAAGTDSANVDGSNIMKDIETGIYNVAAGAEFSFPVDATALLGGTGTLLKAFAWEYPTLRPLTLNYSVSK